MTSLLISPAPCTNCKTTEDKGQWWMLGDYFGITGRFCPKCYDKVAHDSYRNPIHPEEYLEILNKQRKEKHGLQNS